MIHIWPTIEPLHCGLILRTSRMHSEDKDVANRIRIHDVAPETMRSLRTVALSTHILKKSFAGVRFQSLLDES